MNSFIKKISILLLIFWFSFVSVFADNKTDLLDNLNNIKSSFEKLSIDKEQTLTSEVYKISEKYNNIFTDLGYNEDTINNLISLWKLDSNFKWDLVVEYTALKNDIISKVNNELLLLNNLIDDITLNYWEISDSKYDSFKAKIDQFESDLEDYKTSFTDKVNALISKYVWNLEVSSENINQIVENNKDVLDKLKVFNDTFNKFSENINNFNKNYEIFREKFLTYSWDITEYSNDKQVEYNNLLKENFYKLIDKNLELNKDLEKFKWEIYRYADILAENFAYNLSKELNLEYWVLYSESDVNWLISKYNDIKNKYYDAEWFLKAKEVLDSETILSDIKKYEDDINTINEKVLKLIWNSDNSLDTIKIQLENQIIKFYNDNYPIYKDDLATKIKEKISFINLDNKNAISIAESIDIRYEMLVDKIKSQYNISILEKEVNDFKSKINKFKVIDNEKLQLKIDNLNYSLDTFVLNREINHPDYNAYSSLVPKYKDALDDIFIKFQAKYKDQTREKLNIVLDRVNEALEKNLSKKNKFMLLNVKLRIIEFLHNLD